VESQQVVLIKRGSENGRFKGEGGMRPVPVVAMDPAFGLAIGARGIRPGA